MSNNNEGFGWLVSRYENSTKRYREAEDLLVEILNMPWYKKIFKLNKIIQEYLKFKKEDGRNRYFSKEV